MTAFICTSLIALAIMLMMGLKKTTLAAALLLLAAGFGYRLYTGEEARAVMADALFCIALLPIGWWAAREPLKIIDGTTQPTKD